MANGPIMWTWIVAPVFCPRIMMHDRGCHRVAARSLRLAMNHVERITHGRARCARDSGCHPPGTRRRSAPSGAGLPRVRVSYSRVIRSTRTNAAAVAIPARTAVIGRANENIDELSFDVLGELTKSSPPMIRMTLRSVRHFLCENIGWDEWPRRHSITGKIDRKTALTRIWMQRVWMACPNCFARSA